MSNSLGLAGSGNDLTICRLLLELSIRERQRGKKTGFQKEAVPSERDAVG